MARAGQVRNPSTIVEVDHHTVAAISIAGSCLDVLGSLYLAYDLLGGPHGPLRVLTRAVTYSILFGLGYGVGLGLWFGVASGTATGITVAIELNRAAKDGDHYSLPWEALFAAIRACAFSAGLYPQVGLGFATTFAALATGGQISAYARGIRPAMQYSPTHGTARAFFWATVMRAIGYVAAAAICSLLFRHVEHLWLFAARLGFVTGVVTGVGMALSPAVERYADNIPERRMGVFGVALMFCGFALQSVQYWLAVFDVRVT